MINVALQQISSRFAQSNARKTLLKPIATDYLMPYIGEADFSELLSRSSGRGVYVWGSKSERVHQYHRMIKRRTLVLFRKGRKITLYGALDGWVYSPELGQKLWGRDDDGSSWDLVYYLAKVVPLDLAAAHVNRLLKRRDSDNWQAFHVVEDQAVTTRVLELVKLEGKER